MAYSSDSGEVVKWTQPPSPGEISSSCKSIFSSPATASSSKCIISEQSYDEVFSNIANTEVCLCLYQAGTKFAAAYYDAETCQIFSMDDQSETCRNDLSHVDTVFRQVCPSAVITSRSLELKFVEKVKSFCDLKLPTTSRIATASHNSTQQSGNCAQAAAKPVLHLLTMGDFNYDHAKRRIALLASAAGDTGRDCDRRLRANFSVDLSCVCMVRALGGLLRYLDTRHMAVDLDPSGRTPVLAIRAFSLENTMVVDRNTFSALQVFQQEFHPSIFKMGSAFKEGLSLYGISNKCKSAPGKLELKRWFLRPCVDREILRKRHDAVAFLGTHTNVDLLLSLNKHLKSVKHTSRILTRMQVGNIGVGDWMNFYKTVCNCVALGDLLKRYGSQSELLVELSQRFSPDLQYVVEFITAIVNFEESKEEGRPVVMAGYNEELDEKKRLFFGLPDLLTSALSQQLDILSQMTTKKGSLYFKHASIRYVPMLGYFLVLEQNEAWYRSDSDLHDQTGLEYSFANGSAVHFKTKFTQELDATIGDIKSEIIDLENNLLLDLQKAVLEIAPVINNAVAVCAHLDCLISLAITAREFALVRPQFVDENVIEIVKGKHLLLDLCSEVLIPNSTFSGIEHTKIKILTGPNASGKSIYLKQIGIIAYLAHVGSFVPAESAKLCVLDRIFTRIFTNDSVLEGMSTFALDVAQMSDAVANATAKSLVLVDEFGKGALLEVGLPLLMASVEHWQQRLDACPHVFISTHFLSLPELLQYSSMIKYQAMDTVRHHDELVYLYTLVDGVINRSCAVSVAIKAGLDVKVVTRTVEILNCLEARQPVMRANQTEEQQKTDIQVYKQFLDKLLSVDCVTESGELMEDSILAITANYFGDDLEGLSQVLSDGVADDETTNAAAANGDFADDNTPEHAEARVAIENDEAGCPSEEPIEEESFLDKENEESNDDQEGFWGSRGDDDGSEDGSRIGFLSKHCFTVGFEDEDDSETSSKKARVLRSN